MARYWISWYSGGYADEGCTSEPPFQYWWTGQRERENYGLTEKQYATLQSFKSETAYDNYLDKHSRSDGTAVALVEAETVEEIWEAVRKFFPDYQERFCEECELDWTPSDRFLDFANKTNLKE